MSTNQHDQRAWVEFVDRYAPKIYAWCRHWGLQDADAEDVTQGVLIKLARSMARFQYHPGRSFRGFLWTLARNAWKDWLEDRRRLATTDDSALILGHLQVREDLARRLEQEFDLELLEVAVSRVRAQVEPRTWEVYRLSVVEGLAGKVVAEQLGMTVDAVFQAKRSVLRRLKNEILILDGVE